MQFGDVRASVHHRDPHQDVVGPGLGVFDRDVEVAVLGEDARIHDLVFGNVPPVAFGLAAGVLVDQVVVREGGLRVFVQHPHVGMGRGAVEVPPELLDVLAVVALRIGEPEHPLLQDGIPAVPEGQRKAPRLVVVAKARDTVLAPAVGPGAGVVVRQVVPGVAVRAVILANRAPLAFAEVGPPALPALVGGLEAAPFGRIEQMEVVAILGIVRQELLLGSSLRRSCARRVTGCRRACGLHGRVGWRRGERVGGGSGPQGGCGGVGGGVRFAACARLLYEGQGQRFEKGLLARRSSPW